MSPRGSAVRGSVSKLTIALAAVALGALAAPGCSSHTEPVPAVLGTLPTGQLIVDWTLELRKNPNDCQLSGAVSISINVVTLSGLDAGTFVQGCTSFATSLVLDPGSYQASAVLLDVAGQPRTTAVAINPFTILGNDVLTVPIDFPANSFF